jgi:hypothetical protein
VDMIIRGGVQGDTATPGIVVNTLPKIASLEPGLRTMLDLPPISPIVDSVPADRNVMMRTSN